MMWSIFRGRLLHAAKYSTLQKLRVHKNAFEFGLFFDIDGVLVRGGKVLPGTQEAFQLMTDQTKNFMLPTVFVTNAGNDLRQNKAQQLSDWLNCHVKPTQVVMSHSPLKLFRQFSNKHVLVSGQGPVREIANNLGLTRVTTVDELCAMFPHLDMVDHSRRNLKPSEAAKSFEKIEAVFMFGEPVRWEASLQLIIDVLLTNGFPASKPSDLEYPHLPVLACNMDLMWMSEAPMPRFAHGCFLHCLESLYHKISGFELKYTALVGKPSEITYHHSDGALQKQAQDMGYPKIKRMYCIGDNPEADIYGANLYNRYIQAKRRKLDMQSSVAAGESELLPLEEDCLIQHADSRTYAIEEKDLNSLGVEQCYPILVCTGVFDNSKKDSATDVILNHNHRDFSVDNSLKVPYKTVHNAYEAVQYVFRKEGIIS